MSTLRASARVGLRGVYLEHQALHCRWGRNNDRAVLLRGEELGVQRALACCRTLTLEAIDALLDRGGEGGAENVKAHWEERGRDAL